MKYLITENQIKRIIQKKFGIDLTDKISMVTSKWDLPNEFKEIITDRNLNIFLNRYGPMYVIKTPKDMYLSQPHTTDSGRDEWMIFDTTDSSVSELELMRELGIHGLGLSAGDLINAYIEE
jgi:hypothetical protein